MSLFLAKPTDLAILAKKSIQITFEANLLHIPSFLSSRWFARFPIPSSSKFLPIEVAQVSPFTIQKSLARAYVE